MSETPKLLYISDIIANDEREIHAECPPEWGTHYVAYGEVSEDGITYRVIHAPTQTDLDGVAAALDAASAEQICAAMPEGYWHHVPDYPPALPIPWRSLELSYGDAPDIYYSAASIMGVESLREYRRTGGMDGVFFRPCRLPHEQPDDASTWGPDHVEDVDWTGFPTDDYLDELLAREYGAHGGDPASIAMEWLDAGFSAAEMAAWLDAGAWDADRTRLLADAGFEADDIDAQDAYAFCNGDIDLEQVRRK
jgi:hypothetical protein